MHCSILYNLPVKINVFTSVLPQLSGTQTPMSIDCMHIGEREELINFIQYLWHLSTDPKLSTFISLTSL